MTKPKKRPLNALLLLTIGWVAMLLTASGLSGSEDEKSSLLVVDSTWQVPLPEAGRVISFYKDTFCIVQDSAGSLDRFFRELQALRSGKDTVISIVHLGDSHVQCGFLSGQVMRLLHRDFGNAGRGLIVPLKLAQSNEPNDYFIKSTIKDWVKGRCIQATPSCPIGVGGIGIRTHMRKVNLDVIITPENGAGYTFNKAVLFRHPEATPLIATGIPSDSVKTYLYGSSANLSVACDTFCIGRQTDTLLLRSNTRPPTCNNLYYGLSLTNGQAGILYHSIGVNGAMYINYTDSSYIRQLALLKPSLLILSMGTNETFGRRFTSGEFTRQIEALVRMLKHYLPQTALLLTTPPECYKKSWANKKRIYIRNENTQRAAQAICAFARREGISCWDLFEMTGGKGSSKKWYAAKLMGKDRIHFTKETYQEQGTLLYRGLMKAYNQYIHSCRDSILEVQPDSIQNNYVVG